jgi:hypothetical protein
MNVKYKDPFLSQKQCVSFIGYIMLTKSLPCKCAAETEMPNLPIVFQIIQSLNLNYGKALI